MPFNLKYTKACYVLGLSLTFLSGLFLGSRLGPPEVYADSAYEVLKTVSHLNIKNKDFELLISFPDEDVSYYRRKGAISKVKVGDTVYTFRGDEAVVTDISIHGFTIRTEIMSIGDSGTVIRNIDDEQVGYVSQQVGDNLYYCIWS